MARGRIIFRNRNADTGGGGAGPPSSAHPRTLLTPALVTSLRTQLTANTNGIRTRWQTTVTSFEHAGGYWAAIRAGSWSSKWSTVLIHAAYLAAVRTSTDDLGITWGPSGVTTTSWATYKDTCIERALYTVANSTDQEWERQAVAVVYDLLYDHISTSDRATMNTFITSEPGARGTAAEGQFCNGRWDDQAASDHVATVTSAIACEDWATWAPIALAETQDWAEARYHTNQQTNGYEWKQGYPSNTGIMHCMWMLKNALGETAANTTDKCTYHLTHAVPYLMQATIAHPGRALPFSLKIGMAEPCIAFYNETNIAAHVLWSFTLLPGKVSLDATTDVRGYISGPISDQTTLATSENAFLGYLRTFWDAYSWDNIGAWRDCYWGSSEASRPQLQATMTITPWMTLNTQKPTAVTATTAGIPLVRRWWPGTFDLTTIRSGHTIANSSDSLISYWHKRYHINNYEGSTRHNGEWQMHRAGPLLTHRSARGHGSVGRHWTKAANGCVSIVDPDQFPRYTYVTHESRSAGGQRVPGDNSDYWDSGDWRVPGTAVLDNAATYGDGGTITGWYASTKAVVIRSNLKNAYNNDVYCMANEDPEVTAFTRDFVCVRNGGDGTTREKIFTYDRITLTSTDFEPRYNLCPGPPQVDIDGTETAHAGWAPQGETPYGINNQTIQPTGKADEDPANLLEVGDGRTPYAWYASGPTEWSYTGATRVIVHNNTEPDLETNPSSKRHTVVGQGKAQVTPLIGGNAASPTSFVIRKTGGTAATIFAAGTPAQGVDGVPSFGEWHGWAAGDEDDWVERKLTNQRAYVGIYGLQIVPNTVVTDTRYLIAAEAMAYSDTPSTAAKLTSDAGSVVARCGNSAAVFSVSASGHSSGNATIPSGVTLVVFANLPASTARTIVGSGGLTVSSTTSPASASGVIEAVVTGAGTLTWS